ncbi:MAG TPA: hypothetical protein VFD70_16945 [Anaerolineae bacterium]|nr:hypothetical protein [Anaerolineae bacterium]
MLDPAIERWKKFLRRDPTRWLLASDDPSILLWFQLDIAHRPEDAPAVMETRERVLFSSVAQEIFAAQNEMGYWGEAESLAQPYYRATLWNLALLAELGIPRSSRRGRLVCEFVLQSFLNGDGTFAGLNGVESGYLIRALGYFNLARDARVVRAARALGEHIESDEEWIGALWAWKAFEEDEIVRVKIEVALERVIQTLRGFMRQTTSLTTKVWMTFPQFDPSDELFILRVLAEYDRVGDSRVAGMIERLIGKQDGEARWMLERDLNDELLTPLERAGEPSRWVTLNALRVIVKLVRQG